MKIKLYDYDNKVSEFDLGRDDVASIHVCVLSGDEVATVVFSDGSTQKYDASDKRFWSYYDGEYVIATKLEIDRWMAFVPTSQKNDVAAYKRQRMFCDL